MKLNKFMLILSTTALLGAAGCKMTAANAPIVGPAINDLTGMPNETQARLSTAAQNAIASGKTSEALDLYSKLYQKEKTPEVALNYAQLLRKTGKDQQALEVLSHYVNADGSPKDKTPPVILNEYAAVNIENGNYKLAEDTLSRVLSDKNATALYADANDLLGISLDSQGLHKDAEEAYRNALDSWKGDPTSVMNN